MYDEYYERCREMSIFNYSVMLSMVGKGLKRQDATYTRSVSIRIKHNFGITNFGITNFGIINFGIINFGIINFGWINITYHLNQI